MPRPALLFPTFLCHKYGYFIPAPGAAPCTLPLPGARGAIFRLLRRYIISRGAGGSPPPPSHFLGLGSGKNTPTHGKESGVTRLMTDGGADCFFGVVLTIPPIFVRDGALPLGLRWGMYRCIR